MHNKQAQSLADAVGVIRYKMTNDYMFRYILQKNEKVLRGLICSLLRLRPQDIRSIVIKNPIDLSADVSGKQFILDIHIELNNDTYINLEMQVINKHNWPDRSLSYLCRRYDSLYQGQEYEEALPVYHIGFLDYTLFDEAPEFYATYKMMNVKNHHIYSDKFVLAVVDLSRIDLATDEDVACGLEHWARLFKASTWEELKMVAQENEYLLEAANSLYIANSDDIVKEQCRAIEEAERYERTMKRDMQKLRDDNMQLQENIANLKNDNAILKADNADLKAHNADLKANIADLKADNADLKADNADLKANITALNERLKHMELLLLRIPNQTSEE